MLKTVKIWRPHVLNLNNWKSKYAFMCWKPPFSGLFYKFSIDQIYFSLAFQGCLFEIFLGRSFCSGWKDISFDFWFKKVCRPYSTATLNLTVHLVISWLKNIEYLSSYIELDGWFWGQKCFRINPSMSMISFTPKMSHCVMFCFCHFTDFNIFCIATRYANIIKSIESWML